MTNLNRCPEEWKEDVLNTASDRFERRLSEEIGALRTEMVRELASTRVEILRWTFAFWVAQMGANVAIASFLFYVITH